MVSHAVAAVNRWQNIFEILPYAGFCLLIGRAFVFHLGVSIYAQAYRHS